MRDATLVFLIKGEPPDEILLGLKKAGFAQGKFNGFGGKVENGETIEKAAMRELREETGIRVSVQDLQRMAHLTFMFPAKPEWDQVVHVFLARRWEGDPTETGEMKPAWYKVSEIPIQNMWQDDPHWLPLVLRGKRIRARFTFQEDNETVGAIEIEECPTTNSG
jgi:mutator protein MutT